MAPVFRYPSVRYNAPLMVKVVAAATVNIRDPPALNVRSLKLVEPVMVLPPAGMVKFTIDEAALNPEAPALFVQLPATLTVAAVPASKIPEVKVNVLFRVSVVVLPPTLKV
jgi:hypothetical protein